jgi:hypothetical protein
MKFRNPWIDPRVTQVRSETVQSYLTRNGWKLLGPATDPHLLRFERAADSDNDPTLFVPIHSQQIGSSLDRMIECIADLARFEDRWAGAILGEILRQTGDEPLPANGPLASTQAPSITR